MSEKNSEVLGYLKKKMDHWLGAFEGRNLSILSRRTSLSYSYVWRLHNQDVLVKAEKIAPLLDEVCTAEEVIWFYNEYFKNLSYLATRTYQAMIDYNKAYPGRAKGAGEVKEYLRDPAYFHMLALCASDKGCSKASLLRQLGVASESLIQDLLEREILTEKNEVLYIDGRLIFDDRTTILNGIKNSCDIFLRRKDGVRMSMEINSFKLEAIRRVENKLGEVRDLLNELNLDESAKGDVPFFFGAILGRLDFPNTTDDTRKGE